MKTRIGCVPYLNARPLFVPLMMSGTTDMTLMFDIPRRLAGSLAGGLLAGALGPALHAVTGDYEMLPNYGVVSRGAVGSVHLYSHKDPKDWQTISLDAASISSAGLVDVLCRQHLGNHARQVSDPSSATDAYFLIGDADLTHTPAEDVVAYDLGQLWHDLTGLPFLYAAWIVRPDVPDLIRNLLNNAYMAVGHSDFEPVVEDEATRLGLSKERIRRYLSDEIHHRLDDEVFAGFTEYVKRLSEVRDLPSTTFQVAR